MEDMEEEYADSEAQWIHWEVGTYCAARHPENGKWYRARIERVIHKTTAEVSICNA